MRDHQMRDHQMRDHQMRDHHSTRAHPMRAETSMRGHPMRAETSMGAHQPTAAIQTPTVRPLVLQVRSNASVSLYSTEWASVCRPVKLTVTAPVTSRACLRKASVGRGKMTVRVCRTPVDEGPIGEGLTETCYRHAEGAGTINGPIPMDIDHVVTFNAVKLED